MSTTPAASTWKHVSIVNLIALVALLFGFGLAFGRVVAYEAGITRQYATIPGTIPTSVIHFVPATRRGNAIVVAVHGDDVANKEVMIGFGVELAKTGVPSYLMDLPGFGESPVGAGPLGQFETAIDEVVQYARSHSDVLHPKIILLGHSLGAYLVGTYALSRHTQEIAATILISWDQPSIVGIKHPANVLLLVGQDDLPGLVAGDQQLFLMACGGGSFSQYLIHDPLSSAVCGQVGQGTGRRMDIIPNANHISILTNGSALQQVDDWVVSTDGIPSKDLHSNERLIWLLFGVVCAVLALFPFMTLGAGLIAEKRDATTEHDISQQESDSTPAARSIAAKATLASGRTWTRFGLLAAGVALALLFLFSWSLIVNALSHPGLHTPFTWLHMAYVDDIGSFTLVLTLLLSGMTRLVLKGIPWPTWRQFWPQVALGAAVTLVMYLTVGTLISYSLIDILLNYQRVLRFVALLVVTVPLFILFEGLFASEMQRCIWRGILTRLGIFLLLGGGITLAIAGDIGWDSVTLLIPIEVLLFVFFIVFAQHATKHRTQLGLSRAIFMAATLSWMITALFPILQ